jgi:hypothetical protein
MAEAVHNKAVDKMMDPMMFWCLRRLAAASDAAKLFGSWTSRLMATSTRISPLKPESFHWSTTQRRART